MIGKHSNAVELGSDLPARADLLLHEIFSSDLLGEHLLASLEDAKQRLLKERGKVLPARGSIMIALVGGDELGRHLRVGESFGFDLRDFNDIVGRREPLFRYDLETLLLSDAVEAFSFDFEKQRTFPVESRVIDMRSTGRGLCHGVIQWIRIDLDDHIRFENHPANPSPSLGSELQSFATVQTRKAPTPAVRAARRRRHSTFNRSPPRESGQRLPAPLVASPTTGRPVGGPAAGQQAPPFEAASLYRHAFAVFRDGSRSPTLSAQRKSIGVVGVSASPGAKEERSWHRASDRENSR